jgi:hypothetical protein
LLRLSENLYLIHPFSAREGKTRAMAKGPVLCRRDHIFAGESAGFGLPVLKTARQTIFPSLASSRSLQPGVIETVYHLNLTNAWQVLGLKVPPAFTILMEGIVGRYMEHPRLQRSLLNVRRVLCTLFQIRSAMTQGLSFGYCRVLYKTDYNRLEVRVNGQDLKPRGKLILLNEVSGIEFSRLKSGREIREGKNFLPWQPCAMDAVIENADLHLGFSLSFPDAVESSPVQLAAGREIARDLNWAGLNLSTSQPIFTYQVIYRFHQS